MDGVYGTDAYDPGEIAERVEAVGVTKARLPLLSMVALGILAGGFIGLGAMFYTVVASDAALSFGVQRVLGGLTFSLGLILVVIAGAELFTGNNLLVMGWVRGRIPGRLVARNFAVVYAANFVGAVGLAGMVFLSGHLAMNDGAVKGAATATAVAKVQLPFMEAFFRGVLCNILVCLAVWLASAGRQVVNRVMAIVFPITAFVACGFEHCVANMYFIPLGMMIEAGGDASATITVAGLFRNLVPVTLGNLLGGAGMVGLVYYVIYRRGERPGS